MGPMGPMGGAPRGGPPGWDMPSPPPPGVIDVDAVEVEPSAVVDDDAGPGGALPR